LRDMKNQDLSNEMAIDILQKNMPDPKRNSVLSDALIKAIVALKLTINDRRIDRRK